MTLIATKSMSYGGRRLAPGDQFDARPRDARLLIAIGKAKLEPVRAPEAAPEAAPDFHPLDHDEDGKKGGSRKGRTYKRRDLTAED